MAPERDDALDEARRQVRDSLAEFQRLCDQDAGQVIDRLNEMHEDDVRHIVLSLVLKAQHAAVAEGVE